MSTSLDSPAPTEDYDEPAFDLDELAEDDTLDDFVGPPPYPVPSQSLLSTPSGFSIEAIKRLTHDELCHNAEFMRQVNLVDLLLARSNSSPAYSTSLIFFFSTLTLIYYMPRSCCPALASEWLGVTGRRGHRRVRRSATSSVSSAVGPTVQLP